MTEQDTMRCPKCEAPDGLWANASFTGWHSIDAFYGDGKRPTLSAVERGHPGYEVEHRHPELDDHRIGCSHCGWEGASTDLIRLGLDGRPLPMVHPSQLEIGT